MIAAVQIRGGIGARQSVKDTLRMLGLGRVNSCALFEESPANQGMLFKCKDFIAYGPISEETAKKVQKLMSGKTARLHPARGGLKSVKRAYGDGGDLGSRDDMDKLVGRMLP